MKSLSFFKGLSWLVLLNLLVKPVWIFFIDRQVQNTVGHEAYGQYFSVLNLSFVLLFLADAGLGNMLNQRMAHHIPMDLLQLFRIKAALLFVYFIVCCFVAWLTHVRAWELLLYVVIIQALNSLFVFLRGLITASQFFTADACLSIIDKSLMILLCGAILYTSFFGSISLHLFLQIQCICTIIAVLSAGFFIISKKLVQHQMSREINLFKLVLPFALIILLMGFHFRLDGFLLERMHYRGAYEAGIYAAAYRLLDAGGMMGYMAGAFLVPFIARHKRDIHTVEEAVLGTRHGLLLLATGIVPFIIVFAPWLQHLLYHSSDPYNSLVMQLCIGSLPGYYLVHIYGSVLTATSRFNLFIKILVVSVLLNLALNLLLIPAYGAKGCCIAALASQYFCGVTVYVMATKKLNMSYGARSVFVYLFSAALLTVFYYFGSIAISNVWVILAIAGCISILFLVTQIGFLKKLFISFR